jgi:hypothetical protein
MLQQNSLKCAVIISIFIAIELVMGYSFYSDAKICHLNSVSVELVDVFFLCLFEDPSKQY